MTDKNHTMHNVSSTKRIYSFSCMRIAACLAIITLHTVFAANVYFAETVTVTENIISRAVENCMMWAVPSFLMITGALLLDVNKEISYQKLFKRYILRAFLVLLLFSMVFRIFDIIMDGEPLDIPSICIGFMEFFTGTGWGHLWYLYLLIGIYLLLPFYKKIVKSSTDKELIYLAGVYTVFISLLPILNMWGINCGFYICTALIYPLYLFGGYMINRGILRFDAPKTEALIILSTTLIVILTNVRWDTGFAALDDLWGYPSILVIAQTAGLFALMKRLDDCNLQRFHAIIDKLDECSFGIYLIHMLFVRLILRYMQFNPYDNGGILAFIALIIGIYAVSFVITWGLKKIPGLKWLL